MKARALLVRYRKDPRIVVAIPLLIIVATTFVYYLTQRANELSAEALGNRLLLFVLWNINLLLAIGVLFVLLRGLIKALLERQRGVLGSRFRTKLVATYVFISILPIGLMFVVATDLLRVSIDRWFNTPVRTLLRNAEEVARYAQDRAIRQAEGAAREIAAGGDDLDRALAHARQWHDVDLVGVYERGSVVTILADPRSPVHTIAEP
ncbi:MAG TPA: hypothetical protein VGE86_11290, partial [Thermoanaerobaculia bacterium]